MLTGGARTKKAATDDDDDGLQLGDTIRASTPGLPMLDGAELVVIRLDRTGAGSLTLLVTDKRDRVRYGYRQQLSAAEFAAHFRDIELLERATERGFARQNGLVPGKWIRLSFQDGTHASGEIVDLVEDMIAVRLSTGETEEEEEEEEEEVPQQQQLFIDFAYRGIPPEIIALALVEAPFRAAATAASSASFAPEPLDQIQQLVDEADREWEQEQRERREDEFEGDSSSSSSSSSVPRAIFDADADDDFAFDASSASSAGGFDTYTIAVQVDVLVTAMLSRYADAQRTPALLLRVQSAVQRYCHGRRTGMAHQGERALHWIVPPPCPATAFTEQQSPIGADTYGQRGQSTRARPFPIMPRWLLPVITAQSAVCVMPDELATAAATAPTDAVPISLALEIENCDRNVSELDRSDNIDGRRPWRVHSESLRLWRDLCPPSTMGGDDDVGGGGGAEIGTVPQIRSRGGVHAIVSNYDLVSFEHTSGAWDEDLVVRRPTRPKKKSAAAAAKQTKRRGKKQKKSAAAAATTTTAAKRRAAIEFEADEAATSASSSGAETERSSFDDDDDDDESVTRPMGIIRGRAADDSIDFGSDDESVVAGGARSNSQQDDDEAAMNEDDADDEAAVNEDNNNDRQEVPMGGGGEEEGAPVAFVRRQTTTLVRLMPALVDVGARQFTSRDHPDFATLPAPERGYSLLAGDAAAVRSLLCVPPTATSSARSSLFERIAAAEIAVPSSEYVAYMRGRPATDVTQQSWWRTQQQQQRRRRNSRALVHATLDSSDPVVAALDAPARLEMLVERATASGSDLLTAAAKLQWGPTSLDRVLHSLAPASAALRGPGDAALLRQVLARAQRAARHVMERHARQARVVSEARYANEWTPVRASAAESLVATLLFSGGGGAGEGRRDEDSSSSEDDEEGGGEGEGGRGKKKTKLLSPAQQLMLDHLEAEYLPVGRRGGACVGGACVGAQQRLASTLSSEQLLGWLRQDGGAALSALVAHATDHLAPNVPLLLERGARPQPPGDAQQCGPRVLAKTYASTAEMLADAAPVFDADLDPVDYALARRLKDAHSKEMGRRTPGAPGLYDYVLADIERTQAYGPGIDYPRFARSMVVGRHAVIPGNYAVVREETAAADPTIESSRAQFYVRRQPEQGGPAMWVRDPEVQSDAAFMSTEAMLCEIRSLRAPTGQKKMLGPDAFCLATDPTPENAKRPRRQCVSGLALVEQKRTALLDEIARRQRAVHRVSMHMWLARARHHGKRVAPPSGMQQMLTGDRAMAAHAGRVAAQQIGGVVVRAAAAAMTSASSSSSAAQPASPPRAADSPHFSLWRRIDGGEYELGPEARFDAIAKFARAVCRDPLSGSGESPYWLVCKDSGAPLVPIVLRDLAAAFQAGRGSYDALLARLLNEAEDTGEAYVHGPTGTVLRLAESAVEYRFDEDGMAVADRTQEMRETHAARGVAQRLGGAAAKAKTLADAAAASELAVLARSADGQMLHQYVLLLTHHLGAGTGPRLRRAALQMALDIVAHPRVVPNKKTYDASVAKLAKQQQKGGARAPLEYDALVRQRKIAAAAAAVLVAVQTSTNGAVVARDAFRGCVATFAGFPLDPDARQREAVDYVACVLSTVSRDDAGARGLFATPRETALQIERAVLGIALVDVPSVQRAINEKRLQMQQQQEEQKRRAAATAVSSDSTTRSATTAAMRDDEAFFVPPLRPAPPAILGTSTGSVRMRRLAMALVHTLRRQLSRQQLLLLTRKAQLPILSNACCETRRVSALLDYAQRDPEVRQVLREMFATAAAAPQIMTAACGAALRLLPQRRSAPPGRSRLVAKLGPLDRVRAFVRAGRDVAALAALARLPADQTALTAPSLVAQKHGAKETGGPVDRDGQPLDAATVATLQKAVQNASEDQTQTLLLGVFRQTLLPPSMGGGGALASGAAAAAPFTAPSAEELPRAAASVRRMLAVAAAADRFEARTAASAAQATRDLRDALQGALEEQLGRLQAFLKAFCPAREPPISLTAAEYASAARMGAYTDYASLLRLGGAMFARMLLDGMAVGGAQQAAPRAFSFSRPVATVMRRALEDGHAGGAGLGAETGAAQMLDYYSVTANAWGCVYPRRAMRDQSAAATLVAQPHTHWGLDKDDYDYLRARTDLPFQRVDLQRSQTDGRHIVAFAAMQGIGGGSGAMWTAATDHYLRGFRAQADAFRRRATAWIPSVLAAPGAAPAAVAAHELAQMGCLCTLLHACLIFADASGAPGDNAALAAAARPRVQQMAQYLSRLPATLRTGEQPSRAEPAAMTYRQIAERIAFSNDREKEDLKQTFRLLANDRANATLERQLKKMGLGQYGIDAKRLNKYGARNRQGFITHDLNERSGGDGTNAYDTAMHQQKKRNDEDGGGGGGEEEDEVDEDDDAYNDGDEEMEDFGDIDEYGREH